MFSEKLVFNQAKKTDHNIFKNKKFSTIYDRNYSDNLKDFDMIKIKNIAKKYSTICIAKKEDDFNEGIENVPNIELNLPNKMKYLAKLANNNIKLSLDTKKYLNAHFESKTLFFPDKFHKSNASSNTKYPVSQTPVLELLKSTKGRNNSLFITDNLHGNMGIKKLFHKNTESFISSWVASPKEMITSNYNSTSYNFINYSKQANTDLKGHLLLNPLIFHRKKSVSEFEEISKETSPKLFKEYQKASIEKKNIFYRNNGICAQTCNLIPLYGPSFNIHRK